MFLRFVSETAGVPAQSYLSSNVRSHPKGLESQLQSWQWLLPLMDDRPGYVHVRMHRQMCGVCSMIWSPVSHPNISALAMLIFLLSLGGIPFVAGFWAKLYVFWTAAERGLFGLVFLGAVLTVVALYYYLLVARRMYIEEPVRRERVLLPRSLGAAITVCVVGVVGIGVYPGPWVALTQRIASSLFQ